MKHLFSFAFLITIGLSSLYSQTTDMKKDSVYSFLNVDMPAIFPGCGDFQGFNKKLCSKEALDSYIDNILEYPPLAKKKQREGRCIIEYTILTDGSMVDIDLTKDIGDDCGPEALRIFRQLSSAGNIWEPAIKNDYKVAVRMKTAVNFYLSVKGIFIPKKSKSTEKSKAFKSNVSDR